MSLFYYVKQYGEESLDKKLIFIDEVESSVETEPLLRSLTGQTDITPRHLSVYDAALLDLKIKGKRSVWFSSVKTFGTEQIKNRFIYVNPDESIEQDQKVRELQDKLYRQRIKAAPENVQVAQAIFMNIMENACAREVEIPFEINLPHVERRWLYPIFVMFVRSMARVNYRKRETSNGVIMAQLEDLREALRLWNTFVKHILLRASETSIMVYEALPNTPLKGMTVEELNNQFQLGRVHLNTRQIYRILTELEEEGLINKRKREDITSGRMPWEYWRI